ncbi:MAG: hypothetical protein IJ418_11110, partial [Clostridia bacterium]|nr:hypothetical protein [Clostridia bacterium]
MSYKCYCDRICDNSKTGRKQVTKIKYKRIKKKRGWNPQTGTIRASKKLTDKRKTASLSEAASSVATNSHLAGGVYRARTYDLHDV